jgi:hypothetical protein
VGLSPSSTAVDGGRGLRSIPLRRKTYENHHLLCTQRRTQGQTAGLATAPGSAVTIRTLSQIALRGDGRLYIVDAPTAEHGRRRITAFCAGDKPDIGAPPMTTVLDNGRVVAIGANACLALAGASEAIHHWDARLRRDGRVKVRDSVALGPRSDAIRPSLPDVFGEGLY